jgi:hypothetical protein
MASTKSVIADALHAALGVGSHVSARPSDADVKASM